MQDKNFFALHSNLKLLFVCVLLSTTGQEVCGNKLFYQQVLLLTSKVSYFGTLIDY